jgi:hypothetical protein
MKMNESPKIDELLNSYLDGELPLRQRTQLQRLLNNDPKIAQRLKELQKNKVLISSLPAVQAPPELLENIKASLQKRETMDEEIGMLHQSSIIYRFTAFRKLVKVAAMIAIAVTLSVVMYTRLSTKSTQPNPPDTVATNIAAPGEFTGRLELKTKEISAVDSYITRIIEDNGLSGSLASASQTNKRTFTLDCDYQQLNSFLNELGSIWSKFSSAELFVNNKEFVRQVAVNVVNANQIAEIVSSGNAVESARNVAVLNNINDRFLLEQIPNNDINADNLIFMPIPVLTSNQHKPTPVSKKSEKPVHLTIVLSR